MGNNWITENTMKMWRYIIFYLLVFLVIDYLVVHTLTQYVNATELPDITVDVENVLDGDNSEDDLEEIILVEDIGALEILACTSATICITVIVIYTFGISSISSLWW